MAFIQDHLPCELLDFPCKYLRVPLSLRKLTKAQLQPFIDSIAAGAGWKADLLTKRKVAYTGAACTSTVVYIVMDIDLPPWAIKAIDRLRRGFLRRGRKEAKGGHCLVAWTKVCLPKELGGLGISDLQNLGWALQLRWLWLMKIDPTRPWTNFHVPVHKCFQAFFSITVVSEIG